MATTLESLPTELKRVILQHTDYVDLLHVRLVSTHFCSLASEYVFEKKSLTTETENIITFVNVSTADRLRYQVRHLEIDTVLQDCAYRAFSDFDFPNLFQSALEHIKGLGRLRSLTLSHDRTCGFTREGHRVNWDIPETPQFRAEILRKIFASLNHSRLSKPTLKALSINCIQDYADQDFTSSQDFLAVLEGVKVLKLHVVIPQFQGPPSHQHVQPYGSLQCLITKWLTAAISNLTTLSLYQDSYWGWSPKVDLRIIRLPHLRTLALGNFSFAHEIHFQWIMSYGSTLEALYLDDCPIVYGATVSAPLDADGFPMSKSPSDSVIRPILWTYHKRWLHHLSQLGEALVRLQTFRMGHGNWWHDKAAPFIEYEKMDTSKSYLCQYVYYNTATGPTDWRWDLAGSHAPGWPDCEKEDRAALNELWKLIESRKDAGANNIAKCEFPD